MSDRPTITTAHKWLIGGVVTGALTIASISFAGSYRAVRELAERKHFGDFAPFFPIGLDAGIVVLLALDFLLTWLRLPFAGLRPMAWLLTAATIAFNAAAAWPDPLGVAMHAVTPLMFVVVVEAARSAMCKIAAIDTGRRIEPVPLMRWLLSPRRSFGLFRRMHLWQIKTLDEAVALEQKSRMFAAEMRQEFGRRWKDKAPARAAMAHKFATEFGAALDVEASSFVAPSPIKATATPPATDDATAPAMKRPAPATDDAMAPATGDATKRPAPATPPATPPVPKRPAAPKPDAAKAPAGEYKSASKKAAQEIIRPLYKQLGRRPLEGEMTAALEAAGHKYTSRQYAQQRRGEIEHDHPELAALGQENVRPLSTGTDG